MVEPVEPAPRTQAGSGAVAAVIRHLGPTNSGIYRVPAGLATRDLIGELSPATSRTLDSLNPGNYGKESMALAAVWDERDLRRGIAFRMVLGPLRAFTRNDQDYSLWLQQLGAELRFTNLPLCRVLIADGEVALIRSRHGHRDSDVIVLTELGLVSPLRTMFEHVWHGAETLTDSSVTAAPPPADVKLIQLLAEGLTDEAAARRLGISTRQLSRRVARLSAQLGVSGRLALGAAAAVRGWL